MSARFDIDNLNFEKWFGSHQVYCCSKLANILTANVLARKLKGTGKPVAHNFKISCELTVIGKFVCLYFLVYKFNTIHLTVQIQLDKQHSMFSSTQLLFSMLYLFTHNMFQS
jgi:hypothetical protein